MKRYILCLLFSVSVLFAVKVEAASGSFVVYGDSSKVGDAQVRENAATSNYGSRSGGSIISEDSAGVRYRYFCQFYTVDESLSAKNIGSIVVDSAIVQLTFMSIDCRFATDKSESVYVYLQGVAKSWGEGNKNASIGYADTSVTWNSRWQDSGIAWSTAGGDFLGIISDSSMWDTCITIGINDTVETPFRIKRGVAVAASAWLDSMLSANYGVCAQAKGKTSSMNGMFTAGTKESGPLAMMPKITVYYTTTPLSGRRSRVIRGG